METVKLILYTFLAITFSGCTDQGFVLTEEQIQASTGKSPDPNNVDNPGNSSTSGKLDQTFGSQGIVESSHSTPLQSILPRRDYAADILEQEDGKILVLGMSVSIEQTALVEQDIVLMRHNKDGSLDRGFGDLGIVTTNINVGRIDATKKFALQPDGKIVVSGYTTNAEELREFLLLRYNSNGFLDENFGENGVVTTTITDGYNHSFTTHTIQSDGKILAAGYMSPVDGVTFPAILRYNPDGSLDTGFGTNGAVFHEGLSTNFSAYETISILPNGKILASGYSRGILIARYNSDGSLDTGFGIGGMLSFLLSSGVGPGIEGSVGLETLPDDGFVITARTEASPNNKAIALMKFQADGSFDTSFGSNGSIVTDVSPQTDDLPLRSFRQPDGKILVVGYSGKFVFNGSTNILLLRYNPDGSLDNTFAENGINTLSPSGGLDAGNGISLQKDGRILISGYSNPGEDVYQWFIARFLP